MKKILILTGTIIFVVAGLIVLGIFVGIENEREKDEAVICSKYTIGDQYYFDIRQGEGKTAWVCTIEVSAGDWDNYTVGQNIGVKIVRDIEITEHI